MHGMTVVGSTYTTRPNKESMADSGGNKINYNVTKGLIDILAGSAKVDKKEVWCQIQDAAVKYVERASKNSSGESWGWFLYPETELKMKIKIRTQSRWGKPDSQKIFNADISLDLRYYEQFTSEQVDEFLVENILLGNDE